MSAIRALTTALIDYAGLFPPAALDMRGAISHYALHLDSEDAWALGRFIVPAARLPEFSAAFNDVCCEEQQVPWLLSVLVSDRAAEDMKLIADLAQGTVLIDSVEFKADTAHDLDVVLDLLPIDVTPYVEFAPEKAGELLPALAARNARAKIRTGGVTPDAFPSSAALAHCLIACAAAGIAFKSTAGLHHAMRGMHQLTYEEKSPWAAMHGFVNLFLAAAYAYHGKDQPFVQALLDEESPTSITVSEDTLIWRGHSITTEEIEAARQKFAICFGSCSFSEPISELKALGWF